MTNSGNVIGIIVKNGRYCNADQAENVATCLRELTLEKLARSAMSTDRGPFCEATSLDVATPRASFADREVVEERMTAVKMIKYTAKR